MQLYAVNFIPVLDSLYMFRVFYTPIIRSTIFNCIYSHWYKPYCKVQRQCTLYLYLTVWFVPVSVDTVKNCTPDDGCVKRPKHVEWNLAVE